MKKYSVIVPVYNEEEALPIFYKTITPIMQGVDGDYEIIFVEDGSHDRTAEIMAELATKDKHVACIHFSRNFGQQAAIFCGLKYASGDAVVIMDVDLQDPPSLIPELISKWSEGYNVVHARRKVRRGESAVKKFTSRAFLKFLKKSSGLDIPANVGEFKLLDRRVVDTINNLPENDKYLRGLVSFVGFKQGFVDFDRPARVAGKTKYSLRSLFRLAKKSIVSLSTWPLTLSMKCGIMLCVLSLIAFGTLGALVGLNIIPAIWFVYPSIALALSILLIFNGITNIYIMKLQKSLLARPDYIVASTKNLDHKH